MIKIAIIEDDPAISQMYRMKFESTGKFDVYLAGNGEQGVALVKQIIPDIILLDLMMPEMDGVEALTEIRKQNKLANTPAIILSNKEIEQFPDNLKQLGVIDYVVKANSTPSQVVEKVNQALK